ncbi:hypothetical protein CLIB1423_16S01750 [[Candida] railenensis]|uniref:Uncharacterized protein n=1 Tax=[Candida] railenensis TaxID=45579 RepID=A0A9P0QRY5_9ASCO|nr:hypothetical protein CLIB1423_16S01750 [[Candida] railenensis]
MPDLEQQPSFRVERPKLFLAIMAFILPPLPLFLLTGPNYTIFTKEIFISLLLTIFGHIPGIIFSLYVIFYDSDPFASDGPLGYTSIDDEGSDHPHHHNHHHDTHSGGPPAPVSGSGSGSGSHGNYSSINSNDNPPIVVGNVAYEPYTDNETPKDAPPHYNDLEGTGSNGPKVSDTKGTDHKVQR